MCVVAHLQQRFISFNHQRKIFLAAGGGVSEWVKVAQSCLTLCDPLDYIVHEILQARTLEWVAFPFFRGSSQPRDWTQVSRIAGGYFTSWAKREAQEYWTGSLSLLQLIFLTQESNWGLLHWRRIYQGSSHEGSTNFVLSFEFYSCSNIKGHLPQIMITNIIMKSLKYFENYQSVTQRHEMS